MPSASPILHSLRQSIASIGRDGTRILSAPGGNTRARLGHPEIDAALGGGLMRGALHEVWPASPSDHAAATGFALALIARFTEGRDWIWIRQDMADREKGRPYGPGLTGFGIEPQKLIHVTARDTQDILKATEDSLRCTALAAVLCEPWGEARALDLTAARRLTLAAEIGGVPLVMLRQGGDDMPTNARTRWRIKAASSSGKIGPGPARFAIALALNRQIEAHAREGFWITEWSHGERLFQQENSVGHLSLSADRQDQAPRPRARRSTR